MSENTNAVVQEKPVSEKPKSARRKFQEALRNAEWEFVCALVKEFDDDIENERKNGRTFTDLELELARDSVRALAAMYLLEDNKEARKRYNCYKTQCTRHALSRVGVRDEGWLPGDNPFMK